MANRDGSCNTASERWLMALRVNCLPAAEFFDKLYDKNPFPSSLVFLLLPLPFWLSFIHIRLDSHTSVYQTREVARARARAHTHTHHGTHTYFPFLRSNAARGIFSPWVFNDMKLFRHNYLISHKQLVHFVAFSTYRHCLPTQQSVPVCPSRDGIPYRKKKKIVPRCTGDRRGRTDYYEHYTMIRVVSVQCVTHLTSLPACQVRGTVGDSVVSLVCRALLIPFVC